MPGLNRITTGRIALALISAVVAYLVLSPLLLRSRGVNSIDLRTIDGLPKVAVRAARATVGTRPEHPRFDIKDAMRIFPVTHRNRYEPYAGFAYKPNLVQERVWAEHPDGGFEFRTNSLGLREDEEPLEDPVDLRVLVAGDSHVDGVCAQSESFPNRIEALLRTRFPGRRIDVLNAARGGYSFYNYEGVLERFLEQGPRPDVFVVTVYGGNDFVGQMPTLYTLLGKQLPRHGKRRVKQREVALEVSREAYAQALNSFEFFENHSELEPLARDAAIESLLRIHVRCELDGVELIVVYLPSVAEIDPAFPSLHFDELCEIFGLEGDDLESTTRLADGLLSALDSHGVQTLDLRPIFRANHSSERPLFWRADLHTSVAGHAEIAQALEPLIAARFEARMAR